ncbi:TPA: hypothetical protein ACX6RU_002186 [Photobacterium damselae]|uniref:hypothetical protein n=1 Tax=Photobacterium damselae TaxID=38293 RepID=UPI0021D07D33|nr:hypothetical protein [Photobacterium damselae]
MLKMKTFFLYVPTMLLSLDVLSAQLSSVDEAAAFKAAGYRLDGKFWRSDCYELSPTASGEITIVRDLNGDGLPEVIITESSTYCYGNTGYHYTLVSKWNNDSWKLITSGVGIPIFITTENSLGWPDIEVGGPGFCFPVMRWNGHNYVFNRYQYDNAPCSPQ